MHVLPSSYIFSSFSTWQFSSVWSIIAPTPTYDQSVFRQIPFDKYVHFSVGIFLFLDLVPPVTCHVGPPTCNIYDVGNCRGEPSGGPCFIIFQKGGIRASQQGIHGVYNPKTPIFIPNSKNIFGGARFSNAGCLGYVGFPPVSAKLIPTNSWGVPRNQVFFSLSIQWQWLITSNH